MNGALVIAVPAKGRLQENAELFRSRLQCLGFRTLASTTQIVPVVV